MKKRIIIYSVFLGILTALTGLGLYDLVANTTYRNNEVSFKVNNDQTFFEISAQYFYGETVEPTKTFNARYLQEDHYNGVDRTIEPWDFGNSQFVNDDENPSNNRKVLTFIIDVTNRNEERDLNVKLNNIAVHQDASFATCVTYRNDTSQEVVIFNNKPGQKVNESLYYNPVINANVANITTDEKVESNKTLQIKLTFTLLTRTKAFNIDNNFSIELESVVKQ